MRSDDPRHERARAALRRIRRRAADVVGIFPNERAIHRLVGAILLEQNDASAIQKRYLGAESMAQLTEKPIVRLPAAPALAGSIEQPRRTY